MKKAFVIIITTAAILTLIGFFFSRDISRLFNKNTKSEEEIIKELVNTEPENKEIVRFKVNLREVYDENTITEKLLIQKASKQEGYVEAYDSDIKLYLKSAVKFHIFNENIKKISFYPELSRFRLSYWEYVVNKLPGFVNVGDIYSGYTKKENWLNPYLAFLIYRFDRSPENIRSFFDKYKNHIYSCVSEKVYDEMYIRKYLDALIAVYEQLSAIENIDSVLEKIVMDTGDADSGVVSKYPLYKDLIDWKLVKDFEELYKYTDQKEESNTTVIWLYSFWVRRHSENNSKVVYEILKEIREHYKYLG